MTGTNSNAAGSSLWGKIKWLLLLLLLSGLVLFSVQNADSVTIQFFFGSLQVPLIAVLVLSMLLGLVVGLTVWFSAWRGHRRQIKDRQAEIRRLEDRLDAWQKGHIKEGKG
ncbi:MAG: LapA family protein [Bacteroidetes bacterium]|nr:LapA family protein [Bacteroidota bacterium]